MHQIGSTNGFAYYGDRAGWLIAANQHASNEDTIAESNFRVMARALGIDNVGDPYDGPNGVNADDTAAVESYSGAFGPGQFLLVRPDSRAESEARAMLERIEDYPLLDEDDHSELEWENAHAAAVSELKWRYRWHDWADKDALDWIASAYLSHHDHGSDAPIEWEARRERDTLATAIRDWRTHRRKLAVA